MDIDFFKVYIKSGGQLSENYKTCSNKIWYFYYELEQTMPREKNKL